MASLYLVTPWAGRDGQQYEVAGLLLIVGTVLSLPVWLYHRAFGEGAEITDRDQG